MTDFDHVESAFMRSVLEGRETNFKAIHGAAYQTQWAVEQDAKCQLIHHKAMAIRESAVGSMLDCLSVNDMNGAVDAMRQFWSN